MPSGADLFVVCKQCGHEVSPYITECPYCGNRLRRRAPKLPRSGAGGLAARRARVPSLGRLRRGEIPGIRAETRPYATIALVAASCAGWVLTHAGYVSPYKLLIFGPKGGEWWKLFSSQFAYLDRYYAFAAVLAVAIFGWLLERRHGSIVVLALFITAGVTGALAEEAIYPFPVLTGANGGALALLAAWAVPDALAALRRRNYESDLLGAAVIAAALLAMPLAGSQVSWVAGVCALLVGALIGLGLGGRTGREDY